MVERPRSLHRASARLAAGGRGRLVSLILVAASCLGALRCSSAEPRDAQVWVYWGGGAPRSWSGQIDLPSGDSESRITWLADFEVGDHAWPTGGLELLGQQVPGGDLSPEKTRPARSLSATVESVGLQIETSTAGHADGIVLELEVFPDDEISIDLGLVSESLSLVEILASSHVERLADGNTVTVGGRWLDEAPSGTVESRHRVSLHTHSNFSSNPEPTRSVQGSLMPWVGRVWWTDHNVMRARAVQGGSFESPASLRFWSRGSSKGAGANLGAAPGPSGDGSALSVTVVPPAAGGSASAWVTQAGGRNVVGTHFEAAPRLRWAWRPPSEAAATAFVEVLLGSGERLHYSSATEATREGAIPLAATPGTWQNVERDLRMDLAGPSDDAVLNIRLGVMAEQGAAVALFDDVELESTVPESAAALRERILAEDGPPLASFGNEDSLNVASSGLEARTPHLTALLPGSLVTIEEAAEAAGEAEHRGLWVERVQAAGGTVGVHHMQHDLAYGRFLEGGGLGVDLFEIGGAWLSVPAYSTAAERLARDAAGYPQRLEDEVFPQLVRWDRTTARGLLLTGYGAPDLNGLFDRPTNGYFNRWLTWIESDSDSPVALLRALRAGRACGVEWRSEASVFLDSGGLPTGKLVVTDRERVDVRAHVVAPIPDSTLRWIRGTYSAAGGETAPASLIGASVLDSEAIASQQVEVGVEVGAGAFLRAEISEPTGHLVAFSNPVHFIPFWPREWPYGRVAFDWQGVSLGEERDLLLDDARIESGVLVLSGTAFEASARLGLASSARAITAVRSASGEPRVEFTLERDRVFIQPPVGPFELRVDFERGLSAAAPKELGGLPRRKEVFFELDVGDEQEEGGRVLSGFGPTVEYGLGELRWIESRRAEVRLDVPPGERFWVKFVVKAGSRAAGRLLLEGQEVGRFGPADSLVIEGRAAEGMTQAVASIEFDQQPSPGVRSLGVDRALVYRGEGVVDF